MRLTINYFIAFVWTIFMVFTIMYFNKLINEHSNISDYNKKAIQLSQEIFDINILTYRLIKQKDDDIFQSLISRKSSIFHEIKDLKNQNFFTIKLIEKIYIDFNNELLDYYKLYQKKSIEKTFLDIKEDSLFTLSMELNKNVNFFLEKTNKKLENKTQKLKRQLIILALVIFVLSIITFIALELKTRQIYTTNQKLIKSNTKLQRSNSYLEQFAYVAAHELKEPLRMISSYLQIIEARYKNLLDEKGVKFINFSIEGAVRMRDLLDGLLSFSSIKKEYSLIEIVDLNDVLKESQKNLNKIIQIKNVNIESETLPKIKGCKNQLVQLFTHLLDNAIKFNNNDHAKIKIVIKEKEDSYEICIIDTGIGFDIKYHDKIFQIFKQLNSRGVYKGEGIGLTICKRIIEYHHGDIWATSKENEGSKFYIRFPKILD
jgi:signal transduction histidine kinase